MKKHLLPLSCLFLLSACRHTGNTPDGNPSEDLPAGTYVQITLQDVRNPLKRSTYVVDPRTDTVVERRDGRRAVAAPSPRAPGTEPSDETTQAASAVSQTHSASLTLSVLCRVTETAEDGCIDLAIDPKHETSGDPNPIKEERLRIAITERYVKQLAVNMLRTAHRAGVQVHVPAVRAPAK
ncbi:hypothetical protein [Corallococcus macrosporus]|uniref:Putative lipoprotein n=1 Tax=Myxococcus fulvus (strain ATCC BAA-855 / HW-1) TaxID=483219 RepID=F8CJA5_MYXFH|nr:hypothetical protein [Corallococcus macrosporus]AEI68887.1 putative lipoprotein [Corallococcus macrosporus]